jgi:hypothetical protein
LTRNDGIGDAPPADPGAVSTEADPTFALVRPYVAALATVSIVLVAVVAYVIWRPHARPVTSPGTLIATAETIPQPRASTAAASSANAGTEHRPSGSTTTAGRSVAAPGTPRPSSHRFGPAPPGPTRRSPAPHPRTPVLRKSDPTLPPAVRSRIPGMPTSIRRATRSTATRAPTGRAPTAHFHSRSPLIWAGPSASAGL